MLDLFRDHPGRLFVLAALLPLASAFLLVMAGFLRNLAKPALQTQSIARTTYGLLGGTKPGRAAGFVALVAITLSAMLSVGGLIQLLNEGTADETRWAERTDWVRIGASPSPVSAGMALELGYRVDVLSAVLMAMVSVIATLIFLFSLGYMTEELQHQVEDHQVHTDHGYLHRNGRFGRFFLYLSLFAFSMFNLVLADNLFQVFVSWELVGVCSFFLIGFYTERHSASNAANKAFIMNRIGDAGFLAAIMIAWTHFGSLNIAELTNLFNSVPGGGLSNDLWWWLGIGLFLGCAGKSAQVPLQTWLPDAMEGPTPVSALIHAATMVAAGVYLAARCFPFFKPDVLQVIAVVGTLTLFISATIALVQTDIKRVLAFSTCSQLGFMMLAIGIGSWVGAVMHLITHAFFKALLFLGSGSVIHACHHEQDLRKMGGLRQKLPVTAFTMLIGVLAISGVPLLSGWYSKERIIGQVFGLAEHEPWGLLTAFLFVLPVLTVGMTAFYMARLWLMTFAGKPQDHHVFDHAHESPGVMVIPLCILAVFSVGVAWGWPVWNAEASALGHLLEKAQPNAVAQFEGIAHSAEKQHLLAAGVSLVLALSGLGTAFMFHQAGRFHAVGMGPIRTFFMKKWYFDELYNGVFQKPTVAMAYALANADKRPTENIETAARFDGGSLDGLLNSLGDSVVATGSAISRWQTGRLRGYILALGLTAVALAGILGLRAR